MYGVSAYFIAKMIIETPIISLLPLIMSAIVYFKIGTYIAATEFFYFYLVLLLTAHCSSSFGYFMSSVFNHEETAVQVAPTIVFPFILFAGFFSNSGTQPVWISWFQWVSPIRYGVEALV